MLSQNQIKTLKIYGKYEDTPQIGDFVTLCSVYFPDDDVTDWILESPSGCKAPDFKRYDRNLRGVLVYKYVFHGEFRASTGRFDGYTQAVYTAHGLRKVEDIKESEDFYEVTLSEDLHPEWE